MSIIKIEFEESEVNAELTKLIKASSIPRARGTEKRFKSKKRRNGKTYYEIEQDLFVSEIYNDATLSWEFDMKGGLVQGGYKKRVVVTPAVADNLDINMTNANGGNVFRNSIRKKYDSNGNAVGNRKFTEMVNIQDEYDNQDPPVATGNKIIIYKATINNVGYELTRLEMAKIDELLGL